MNFFILTLLMILTIIVIVEMIFMYKLAKFIGKFLNRFESLDDNIKLKQLEIGDKAPIIRSKNQYNQYLNLPKNENENLYILFKDKNCGTCVTISNQLPSIEQYINKDTKFAIIQKDKFDEEYINSIEYYIDPLAFEEYKITIFPTLVIIDNSGNIVKNQVLNNFEELREMFSKPLITHYN